MDQEKSTDQFHDNELGDIYDLYNACNGAMLDGLLDIRKLNDLSHEELEVFDVARLRKVWAHTASGCSTCARIIHTLNLARGIVLATVDEPSPEPVLDLKARHAEPW